MSSPERLEHWPTRMLPDGRPERGDIVIAPLHHSPGMYALSTMPDPPQIACSTYDDALARARRFAERHPVDVWVADGERRFVLVVRRRTVAEGAA